MVRIDVFDYFNNLGKEEKFIENFTELKNELENLDEINELIDNFERNSFFHSKYFLKKATNQHLAMKLKLLNSELREKNEIFEKLHSLAYNLGLLRTVLFVKDENIFKNIKKSFLTNEYSSINVILKDLNNFKEKIIELETNYKALINENYSSVDFKVRHEHDLEEHFKKLNGIYEKQKLLLLSMGKMFVNSMDKILKNKKI